MKYLKKLLAPFLIACLLPVMALAKSGTAPTWEEIMQGMDWNSSTYSYTAGEGSRAVHVTREGKNVTFSGGEIATVVRFVNIDMWGKDYQEEEGWHTESGSYTFHNVTLLDDIYVWAHKGENYKIALDASVKGNYGITCTLLNGANLDLVNNDIIYCDTDYSMIIEADTDCSMSITGNGKILIGEGHDWSAEGEPKDEVPIRVVLTSKSTTNAEALRDIKDFEGRVVVSYDQVKVSNGYPPIRSYCNYTPFEDEPYCTEEVIDPESNKRYELDTTYIVKKLRPGKGAMTEPILTGKNDLDEGALYRPLLVTVAANDALYLRSEITQEMKGQSIEYEIHMVDAGDEQVELTRDSTLYIPYPEGMDMESAAGYAVTIRHTTATDVDVFSTEDGSIQLTPYGFYIPVSSLSPFVVTWNNPASAASGALPQTGDPSQLCVYALFLFLSAGALTLMRRPGKSL